MISDQCRAYCLKRLQGKLKSAGRKVDEDTAFELGEQLDRLPSDAIAEQVAENFRARHHDSDDIPALAKALQPQAEPSSLLWFGEKRSTRKPSEVIAESWRRNHPGEPLPEFLQPFAPREIGAQEAENRAAVIAAIREEAHRQREAQKA